MDVSNDQHRNQRQAIKPLLRAACGYSPADAIQVIQLRFGDERARSNVDTAIGRFGPSCPSERFGSCWLSLRQWLTVEYFIFERIVMQFQRKVIVNVDVGGRFKLSSSLSTGFAESALSVE